MPIAAHQPITISSEVLENTSRQGSVNGLLSFDGKRELNLVNRRQKTKIEFKDNYKVITFVYSLFGRKWSLFAPGSDYVISFSVKKVVVV